MKKALIIALLTGGCATSTSKLTTTRLEWQIGTNKIVLVSPKDSKIEELQFGSLTLRGYSSIANAGAVEANQNQAFMLQQLLSQNASMLQNFGILAARAYGVPTGNLTTTNR